jgi:predicted GH43/DUF377 family glycosyl hydrolase
MTNWVHVSYGIGWANASNTPFYEYKVQSFEGGIATPFIAHFPKMIQAQKGKIVASKGYLIDIMPTLLDISSANYPSLFHTENNKIHPLEGKSLVPVFKKGSREDPAYMYWEHQNHSAIRKGDWKAVKKVDETEWALYDLKTDRIEQNNVAKQHPELVKELNDKWYAWANTHFVLPKKINKINPKSVPDSVMKSVFEEVKTPYKYGVVFKHPDSTKLLDSPSIFRKGNQWYMTYIVFDGQGYETWLAESNNLLDWKTKGRLLSFGQNTWDANQKAGYMALVDTEWGGSYEVGKFKNKYWMSYLGGNTQGYEAGVLGVGMANNSNLIKAQEWKTLPKPVLQANDEKVRWFENKTIYKSLIIRDKKQKSGHPFVMYYNAKGDTANYESIGMAVSDNMVSWQRWGDNPVITKYKGICGDAQIAQINDVYVLFYFGAFWKKGAFERFACSYDLQNWTDWQGADLIEPSESYDAQYAHKPWVIKWKGVVYHFYNAVGKQGRVIALATSKELKK